MIGENLNRPLFHQSCDCAQWKCSAVYPDGSIAEYSADALPEYRIIPYLSGWRVIFRGAALSGRTRQARQYRTASAAALAAESHARRTGRRAAQ